MRLLIVLSLLLVGSAHGATLSVSPSYFEMSPALGQSPSEQVVVYNSGNKPMHVKLYVGDFWYDKAGKRTFPAAGKSPYSAASWVHLPESEMEIAPGASSRFSFVLSVPEGPPASAYATVFVEEVQGKDPAKRGGSVAFSLRIAVPILYRRPDATPSKILFEKFSLSKPSAFKPLVVRFNLMNDDESYVFPEGSLLVVRGSSKELAGKDELKKERVLLPKQRLLFEIPLSIEPVKGRYEGLLTLFYGADKHIIHNFSFNIR
ncbi:MAG: hypothetical protein HY537_11925 [Deltaproteobacteria bacterium]|nr:hypothetical protein [Deltaproteobacteria bacterium]